MGIALLRHLLKHGKRSSKKHEVILQEDFLKALYGSTEVDTERLTHTISRQASIPIDKMPQVIGALILSGDIETSPIRLTDKGRERALSLIRKHRIYEAYLAEHSGYHPDQWHELANQMEHTLSAKDEVRINQLLRNPLWDPHGDPIPTDQLLLPERKANETSQVLEGYWYHVLHIEDDDLELFRMIHTVGITLGAYFHVTKISAHHIRIDIEGETATLPIEALGALNLTEVSPESDAVVDAQAICRLSTLHEGQVATISHLSASCCGAMRRRLMDLGFVRGSSISIDMTSPLGNPTTYVVRGSAIALRRDQARYILVTDIREEGSYD